MTGVYQHSLDAKGRLFIPAKLREELGDVFYVTLSMDKCLSAYSAENWQVFSDKVNAMPYVKQRKMRCLPTPPAASWTGRAASCCRRTCAISRGW